jgi:transcriptional regulator with XRE-family HTH domain
MRDSKISTDIKVEAPQPFLQAGLKSSFGLIKKMNSRVSMRSFAQRLGISHSAMSEILKGKRKVSKVKAEAFADALKITGEKRNHFLTDFNRIDPIAAELSEATFQLFADPDYFSLLTLVDTRGFWRIG